MPAVPWSCRIRQTQAFLLFSSNLERFAGLYSPGRPTRVNKRHARWFRGNLSESEWGAAKLVSTVCSNLTEKTHGASSSTLLPRSRVHTQFHPRSRAVQCHAARPDQGRAEARAGAWRAIDLSRAPVDAAHRPREGSPSDAGVHIGLGAGGASQSPRVQTQRGCATEDRP